MENKNLKPIPFKKDIKGRLILEIELPIEFKIDAVHEAKLSEVLFQIRKAGFTINEYKIEEC